MKGNKFKKVLLKERLPQESDGTVMFLRHVGNTCSWHSWCKFTEEEMRERFYAFLIEDKEPEVPTWPAIVAWVITITLSGIGLGHLLNTLINL